MGAQHTFTLLTFDPKRILHASRRMVRRNVKPGKVVEVVFDLGTEADTKSHSAEDVGNLANGDSNGV